MTIALITIAALLLIFFGLVFILKVKDDLTWKSAFREALEYIF